jgi:PASTA domain
MRGTGRFVIASGIAVVVMAALLPGSGLGSRAVSLRGVRPGMPSGLAAAIRHASTYDPGFGDPQLGTSVVLSADGTTALVGAPGVDKRVGAVYVFHVSSAGAWTSSATPTATLKPGGTSPIGLGAGVALSADGTTAFVGAPYYGAKVGQLIPPGAVLVFHVASEDAWSSTSTPTATLTTASDGSLGFSLAVSNDGTTLLAGGPFLDGWGGGAEVFHASDEAAWVSSTSSTATLTDSGQDTFIGTAVALSSDGTTALLSDTTANNGAGGAIVFHVASADAWASSSAPAAYLSNEGRPSSHAALGWAVALSGDGTTAFLGAPGNVDGSPTPGYKKTAGAVDVFHVSGADLWAPSTTPTATLTKRGGAGNDALGALVAASADGATAVITAPGVNKGKGAAYVFRASAESAWSSSGAPAATLAHSAGTPTDFFGGSEISGNLGISVSGATLLVGAPGTNWNTGAAYVFHESDASSWLSSSKPTATLTNSALPKPVCVVPDLIGLNLSDAEYSAFGLAAHKCRLGKVTRVHAKPKKRGLVVSQSPRAGRHLRAGAKVSVRIGKK